MCRNETYGVAFDAVDSTKLGIADSHRILQHGFEHRLKVAGRTGYNPQHIRRRRLLLQRFGKLPRALLLGLKQPHVLDRDHCLVGEGGDQFDLLFGERPYGSALQVNMPIGIASRKSGTPRMVRKSPSLAISRSLYSGSARTSGI